MANSIVVVTRVNGEPPIVPGSVKENCSDCDEECWVSPATASSTPPNIPKVCLECMLVRLKLYRDAKD